MSSHFQNTLSAARRAIDLERQGLVALEEALIVTGERALGTELLRAIDLLLTAHGRTIITGIGKSGHIARKIAATLASTGQPAMFVHPAEASHGDLGMVQNGDVVLALSWSGESIELASIITYTKRFSIPLIALTSQRDSTLGRQADILLCLPQAQEACPNGLAPTTSTTMQLALGDALAMALLEAKGFTARDFRDLHPGGRLGAKLAFVRDIMHKGEAIPRIQVGASLAQAIVEMTSKGFGCVGVFHADGSLAGLITDGDLRRHLRLEKGLDIAVEKVMTPSPRVIAPDALVAEALGALSNKISNLLVVEKGEVVGILHFHDLIRHGAA